MPRSVAPRPPSPRFRSLRAPLWPGNIATLATLLNSKTLLLTRTGQPACVRGGTSNDGGGCCFLQNHHLNPRILERQKQYQDRASLKGSAGWYCRSGVPLGGGCRSGDSDQHSLLDCVMTNLEYLSTGSGGDWRGGEQLPCSSCKAVPLRSADRWLSADRRPHRKWPFAGHPRLWSTLNSSKYRKVI